ncbi:MAG: LamG-like jellyroll fold domain-containing protein [Kofleriaceae bacterium]
MKRVLAISVIALAACGFRSQAGGGFDAPVSDPDASVDAPRDASPDGPPDAATCANGTKDPDELGVDCGMVCNTACLTVFEPDANTLALLELNGDVSDSSGNARDATLIGGTFESTSWGMGLALPGTQPQGFQWTDHAGLLAHPYTVEMVVTPTDTACFQKLFGAKNNMDAGWYYCDKFDAYPNEAIGPSLVANERHYFAIVSRSATEIDVYVNGAFIGSTDASFSAPPMAAIFFRDDTHTDDENLTGVVDAVRISNIARSESEIESVADRLAKQP